MSRLTIRFVPVFLVLSLTGCTIMVPLITSGERTEYGSPYSPIDNGATVEIALKDTTVKRGVYAGFSEERDPTYESRFAAAVREDSTFGVMPVPGDTVSVTVSTPRPSVQEGVFVGVGDLRRPGVYLDVDTHPAQLFAWYRLEALERSDGTTVDYPRLQKAVLSGRIPSMQDRTIRQIQLTADGRTTEIDARGIDHITISRKRNVTKALLIGLAIDVAVVGVMVLTFDPGNLFANSSWGY